MNTIKNWLVLAGAVGLVTGGMLIWRAVELAEHEKQLANLRNTIAANSVTIETSEGIYQRISTENKDLIDTLDKQDMRVAQLTEELRKSKEELLVTNGLVIKWKKAYEGKAVIVWDGPAIAEPGRETVSFIKDFGYIFVSGHTKTNPSEAYVKLEQRRPLKLTLVVSQREDKSWVTHVTSSEENMGVDISLAAVNPHMFDVKWYERVALNVDLAAGPDGFLGGLGLTAQIGNFDVGPKVFAVLPLTSASLGTGLAVFYGGTIAWHPFGK
jgi:hypothetical protein